MTRWSVLVQPLDETEPWLAQSPEAVLRTASIGKLLLLSTAAEQMSKGRLDPSTRIAWEPEEHVRDSGLWHALDQRDLSALDLCRLIGAVSDNLATNALLRVVGLDAVRQLAQQHDLAPMALLDQVRDDRDPALGHGETLSRGSAAALVRYLRLVHEGALDQRVLEWLALDCDLSMVASAFGLDPLAHAEEDRGVRLVNKTGTDSTCRCDVGLVEAEGRSVAYAVLAGWDDAQDERDAILARMRDIGTDLRTRLIGRTA